MADGGWTGLFAQDTLREAAQQFGRITNGFTKRQLEWSAAIYFQGVADGARLARDTDLERMVRSWITGDLRPNGWAAAAKSLGVRRGKVNAGAEPRREDGAGARSA